MAMFARPSTAFARKSGWILICWMSWTVFGPQAVAQASATVQGPELALVDAYPNLEFERPVFVAYAKEDAKVAYVVEQVGKVVAVAGENTKARTRTFLDIRSKVYTKHNEEGLLTLAFHPQYQDNGYFYVYYSANNPRRGVLSRFQRSAGQPSQADPESEHVILEIAQPWGNHNGCMILFGPDNYLYVSLGDGGAANDPLDSGQDLSTLLGTILRIDVDSPSPGLAYGIPEDNPFIGREDARAEIWAYGLRNVWRMSFDRKTGDLWAADVGQNLYEEIDLIKKGGNYGWRIREGMHDFKAGATTGPFEEPIVEYHHRMGLSVTGGYVYRGTRIPALQGAYLYGDYLSKRVWALRYEDGEVVSNDVILKPQESTYVASFAETPDGEILLCGFDNPQKWTGKVYKLQAKK